MLFRFFLNSHSNAHLRALADEFGESTNAIRHELNNLCHAGFLLSAEKGNTISYRANTGHPLYPEIQKIIHKCLGLDKIVDNIVNKLITRIGELDFAFITGDYAHGKDTGIIDLVLVGNLNVQLVQDYVVKAEQLIDRKIRVLVLTPGEFEKNKKNLSADTSLYLWKKDQSTAVTTEEAI